jgi:hypothetical protein
MELEELVSSPKTSLRALSMMRKTFDPHCQASRTLALADLESGSSLECDRFHPSNSSDMGDTVRMWTHLVRFPMEQVT